MDKNIEAFRKRFLAYKNGKAVSEIYDAGLPKYATGTEGFDDTIEFLKQHEGFKNSAYKDANGVPTIGYGFTDPALVKRGKISRSEADVRLVQELVNRDRFLSKLNNWDKLGEGAKSALRSYYYNYPAGFKEATKFMKAWNAGNYSEAIRQVDAGWNDVKNPGLRTRRQAEQQMLREDPFLMSTMKAPEVKPAPIINVPVSTAVRQTIPAEQTIARWAGAEDVSPYITGRPMIQLQPKVKLPTVKEVVELTTWKPGFKCGKLPKYEDGLTPEEQKAYDNAYNWMSSYYRSPGYMQRYVKLGPITNKYLNSSYNAWSDDIENKPWYAISIKPITNKFSIGAPTKWNGQTKYTRNLENHPSKSNVVYGNDFLYLTKILDGAEGASAHELGHSLEDQTMLYDAIHDNRLTNLILSDLYPIFRNSKSYKEYQRGMRSNTIHEINMHPEIEMDGRIDEGHDGKPSESYADMQSLRYLLNKEGIFDARTKDIFTKEHLEQYKKKRGTSHRLFKNFSDDDIIWMMNNVASINNKKNDNGLLLASCGKLPSYKNGKIYIKPSKRGSFTAAAKRRGMTVSQLESAVLKNPSKYSKAMRKKALFSRNARSWSK